MSSPPQVHLGIGKCHDKTKRRQIVIYKALLIFKTRYTKQPIISHKVPFRIQTSIKIADRSHLVQLSSHVKDPNETHPKRYRKNS